MADNLALVRRMFDEVINHGKLDVIDELFTEDFVDHGPTGDLKGREAFKAMVSTWRAAAPDLQCEVLHGFASGDMVGWVVHTTGTHTGDDLGIPGSGTAVRHLQREHRPVRERQGRRALGRAGHAGQPDPVGRHPVAG